MILAKGFISHMKWMFFAILLVSSLYDSCALAENLNKKVEDTIREMVLSGVEPVKFLKDIITESEISELEKKQLMNKLTEKIDYYGTDRAVSEFVRDMNESLLSELSSFYSTSAIKKKFLAFRSGGFMKKLRFLLAYLDPFRFGEIRQGRILPCPDGFFILTPDGMERLVRHKGRPIREGKIKPFSGKLATVYGLSIEDGFTPLRVFER
ncbi:MAG: hypothetical protein GX817_04525 [Elusimicrobia bacterium]|nr:hypothetical protein [Elusimicrobiota bacterium]